MAEKGREGKEDKDEKRKKKRKIQLEPEETPKKKHKHHSEPDETVHRKHKDDKEPDERPQKKSKSHTELDDKSHKKNKHKHHAETPERLHKKRHREKDANRAAHDNMEEASCQVNVDNDIEQATVANGASQTSSEDGDNQAPPENATSRAPTEIGEGHASAMHSASQTSIRQGEEEPSRKVQWIIHEDSGVLCPVILDAPGLEIPPDLHFESYFKPNKPVDPDNPDKEPEGELLLHAHRSETLDYVAREEPDDSIEGLMKHYIGVYDPETKQCELVRAKKLTVRAVLRALPENVEEEAAEKAPKSQLQKRIELGQEFGTKKSQKIIENLTRNAVTDSGQVKRDAEGKIILDAKARAVLESMQTDADAAKREALELEAREAKPVPKPNEAAETPAEVYTLEDLVGGDVLQSVDIREWRQAVDAKEDVQTASLFVSKRLRGIARSGDSKKLRALKLLLGMLEWFRCLKQRREGRVLPPKEKVIAEVKAIGGMAREAIRKKFAPNNSMNRWDVDFFLTHVCALALIIDDFYTNISHLYEDLQIDLTSVAQYYRELGCKVKKPTQKECEELKLKEGTNTRLARLRLPLQFPKAMAPQIRRR